MYLLSYPWVHGQRKTTFEVPRSFRQTYVLRPPWPIVGKLPFAHFTPSVVVLTCHRKNCLPLFVGIIFPGGVLFPGVLVVLVRHPPVVAGHGVDETVDVLVAGHGMDQVIVGSEA